MKASSPWLILITALTLLLLGIGVMAILLWRTSGNPSIPRVLPTFVPIAVAGADTATRSLDGTPLPATYTPIPSVTAHPNSSPTPSPTLTPTAEPTLTPSHTPTPRVLAPGVRFEGTVIPPLTPPVTAIPTAVPTFAPSRDITTILLLGSDTVGGVGRTDTMILVAVNRNLKTASMLSLPRDLYVYIPGWTMNRLNTAMARGESSGYPGGGVALLTDTIKYNFGVQVDYYAQVDFVSFKTIVDAIGGVELVVTCGYSDWRLKSPELNPNVEDNWEIFTLERGVQQMDGDLALWYARSRLHSSDFDRGRRQQQLLRAMFNKGVDVNLLSQIPTLWETYRETVRTNLDIGTILQLASIAPQVRQNGIQNLYLVGNDQIRSWSVPETGAAVQLPNWERMQETFTRLYLPPSLNRATRPPITVELLNATGDPVMTTLTAENLAWYGFIPIVNETPVATQTNTVINYYASNFKGSYDWLLSWVMNEYASTIQLVPDTPYPYNYQITIGTEYNPCRPSMYAPKIDLE